MNCYASPLKEKLSNLSTSDDQKHGVCSKRLYPAERPKGLVRLSSGVLVPDISGL